MFSLTFEGKGSGKVFAFGLFLFSSLPVLDTVGYIFFGSETGQRKTKQTKVHLNFEGPGTNFWRHFMQQKCRLQQICLLLMWNWTFYPRLSSSSRAFSTFFFLCNSAASRALGPELHALMDQAISCRMLTVACPHTKSDTSLSGTQVHSLVTSTANLFPTSSSLFQSLLTSHCDLTCYQLNNSLHH